MKNVTFNILKAIQNLRDAGFSESQASAIVGMMGDAFGATVTTKADLAALESRVYRFMVVQTGVTVGLIFAALFILIGGFGTFHRESASDAVQGQTSWRGLVVAPEQRCAPYDADDYQYPQSVEDRIVAELGGVYGPYTGQWFANKSETDIEHMVARSEAHDSGLCAADNATRRRFATDLLNLTLASPSVNRNQKRDHDAAEWLPDRNRCWFADRVVAVRQKYGLTIDQREAAVLDRVLSTCSSTELSMLADGTAPAAAPAAVRTNDSIAQWDDNGNGRVSCAEARAHGIAPVSRDHPAYPFMRDGDGDGVVCE